MARELYLALAAALFVCHIDGQSIRKIVPRTVRPGFPSIVRLSGENLQGINSIASTLGTNATIRILSSAPTEALLQIAVKSNTPAFFGINVASSNSVSDLELLAIDPLPLTPDRGTNLLGLPIAIDAAVEESKLTRYPFRGEKGSRVHVELVANRIGSLLDPWLRLLDPSGKEIVFGSDIPSVSSDPAFETVLNTNGVFTLELRDIGYQGGSKYFYHLRVFSSDATGFLDHYSPSKTSIREVEPNNTPESAQVLTPPVTFSGAFSKPGDLDYFRFHAKKDERLIFSSKTRTLGTPCDALLTLFNTNLTRIAASTANLSTDAALTNRFSSGSDYLLRVQELTGQGGPNSSYELTVMPFRAGFTLSAEIQSFDVSAQKPAEIKITAQRFDYEGPIQIDIDGATELQIEGNTIPEKKNETTLKIKASGTSHPGLIAFTISGHAKTIEASAVVKSTPALQKLLPLLAYPPESLTQTFVALVW